MYEVYCKLRDEKGLKDADISKGTGIAKATLSDWKNGKSVPKLDKIQLIADFFGVPISYFTESENEQLREKQDEYYLNSETKEMAQFMFDNPEYKVLFDATRKVKPDDLTKALKAIGLFIDED